MRKIIDLTIKIVIVLFLCIAEPSFAKCNKTKHDSTQEMITELTKELSMPSVKKFIPKQKIKTSCHLAELYFQYGMLFKYSFDHLSANQMFTEATRLDPKCAMCYWGIALTIPQSINGIQITDYGPAHEAIEQALRLSKNSPTFEKDMIYALSKRFVKKNGKYVQDLDQYADYMRSVVAKYPDNEEALSLLADSLIEIGPYGFWNKDGTPQKNTLEMVKLINHVLKINPFHPGANHYKIHAYEFSKTPDRAFDSAVKLHGLISKSHAFTHLVHMPSHIFNRCGMYDMMIQANKKAIGIGDLHIKSKHDIKNYIEENYLHDLHVLWYALTLKGQYKESSKVAQKILKLIDENKIKDFLYYKDRLIVVELFNNVRFSAWNEILKMPDIYAAGSYEKAIYHYARGLAYHYKGEEEKAQKEKSDMDKVMHSYFKLNDRITGPFSKKLIKIANLILSSALTEKMSPEKAENFLHQAIKIQDNYNFSEPAPWYFPIRDSLGAMLIKQNRFKEAKKVFMESLNIVKNSGWSLWGLYLAQQGLKEKTDLTKEKLQNTWKGADVKLSKEPQFGSGFMVIHTKAK